MQPNDLYSSQAIVLISPYNEFCYIYVTALEKIVYKHFGGVDNSAGLSAFINTS